MLALTSIHRRNLTALAHGIKPVVWIGTAGLSESVIHELDRALKSHELIKIKIAGGEREMREAVLEEICERLGAAPVRHIGRILVIYRPKEDEASGEITNGVKTAITRSSSTAPKKENPSRRAKEGIPRNSRRLGACRT